MLFKLLRRLVGADDGLRRIGAVGKSAFSNQFCPHVEELEGRLNLSVSVNSYVDLLNFGPTLSAPSGTIFSSTPPGTTGSASATASDASPPNGRLSAQASGGDGLMYDAGASAGGKWTFQILGVPSGVSVPLEFSYVLSISVSATSIPGNRGSLSSASARFDIMAGAARQLGSQSITSQAGAITSQFASGWPAGTISDKFTGSGAISVSVSGAATSTPDARSTANVTFQLLGVASPSEVIYPALALQFNDGRSLAPNLATDANVSALAKILMSEASIGNTAEQTAVGWTVRNRLLRNATGNVPDVWNAYAHDQAPSQQMIDLARSILASTGPDPTNGATHYYSPRSYSVDYLILGSDGNVYDPGGIRQDVLYGPDGTPVTEQTPGLSVRNYIPRWVPTMDARQAAGVRPAYFKFYRAPGNGPVR